VNVEAKEESNQWIHTPSSNKPKKFKRTLSARKLIDGNCFQEHKRSADVGIHATRDRNNATSVLYVKH
jgi:hypothetical protein